MRVAGACRPVGGAEVSASAPESRPRARCARAVGITSAVEVISRTPLVFRRAAGPARCETATPRSPVLGCRPIAVFCRHGRARVPFASAPRPWCRHRHGLPPRVRRRRSCYATVLRRWAAPRGITGAQRPPAGRAPMSGRREPVR